MNGKIRMKTEIIIIKKLKKDGTIDASTTEHLADLFKNGKIILMPVDMIYGLVSLDTPQCRESIQRLIEETGDPFVRMISSFKMLDQVATIDKLAFDFLHRIWPGELIVLVDNLRKKGTSVSVRMPKGKYQQEIIEYVGKPLVYASYPSSQSAPIYSKKDIIKAFDGKIDCLLIIDEFCKEHTLPSVVDISKGTLDIIHEGKVSSEEIKSLYFLGKDDQGL
jgi:tRNA threonylcarbamoyl adenosine modification protein (Sua5/YciO/YrdC/YwlC family)